MSTGYLVMRCVTSRMHSWTPCRFSTAERVTFCKGGGGGRVRAGAAAEDHDPHVDARVLLTRMNCWKRLSRA